MFTQLQDIKAYKAAVEIPEFRFVNIVATSGEVGLGAAGGVNFPSARQKHYKEGEMVSVQLSGSGKVVAAENITQGQTITSDAEGKAVAGTDAAAKIALNDAAEGELVEFKIL